MPMQIYREPISDRQMAALRARAHDPGLPTSDMTAGVIDASKWLADRLDEHPQYGERAELRRALREYALTEMKWDVSDYDDGVAAVLDDVLAILDYDHDVMLQWTAVADLRAEQQRRLSALDAAKEA